MDDGARGPIPPDLEAEGDGAEAAGRLRRLARARLQGGVAYVVVSALAFLLLAQVAPPGPTALLFCLLWGLDAAERTTLRRLQHAPPHRLADAAAARRAFAAGALNALAISVGLWLIWRDGGDDARPVVTAMLFCQAVYGALAYAPHPALNLLRQGALITALGAIELGTLAARWPDLGPATLGDLGSGAMTAVMLGIIFVHMHAQTQRRDRALRELREARREAERRSRTLEQVRDSAEQAALHDALTGLPNRRYLERRMADLAASDDPEAPAELAMLLIDLDRFKGINDTLGHDAGDAVLRRMADILRDSVREGDFVARLGGDEFVVLLPSDPDGRAADSLARRLIAAARAPVPYGDQLCRFGASVGLARAPRSEARLDTLLVRADIALYRAKARGRGRAERFSEALQAEVVAARRLGDDILRGLEAGEFAPFHQPVLHAADGTVAAVEAVARWRHPERGLLGPGAFLEAAAETGALAEIDRAILARALADRAGWAAAGLAPPPLSVNVSAARLADPDLAEEVAAARLPPGALIFELGDAAGAAAADERVRWTLDRLTGLGVELEVDDFGVGPISVAALAALGARRIKVDRRFVAPLTEAPERRALVAALVDLARSLGLGVVAEGVETEAQAEILRAMGCERLQGYAFAPPMSADRLADWLRARPAAAPAPALTPAEAAYIRAARI